MASRERVPRGLPAFPFAVAAAAVGAALLAGGLACGRESSPSGTERPPDLVLVVIDTARGDRFSLYGHERETSPRLAAFASDAIVFERAYATSCWTLPSHASLFTGLLPMTHGATQEHLRLDASLETLASLLGAKGYQSAAFSNNSWVSEFTGLTRGFDRVVPMWKEETDPEAAGVPHPTNREIFGWLDALGDDASRQPFLLFVNYIEPHWPYRAPRPHRERFLPPDLPLELVERSDFPAIQWYLRRGGRGPRVLATRERLYEAEISYADAVVGELLDGLAARGHLYDALVVVTSDHGEHLGEHGHQGHSFSLYEPTLRVPLVVRPPGAPGALGSGVAGARRADPVHLPDVFATLAHAAGAEPTDPRVVGRDLLSGALPGDRPLVAEYYTPEMFIRRFPDTPRAREIVAPHRRRLRALRIGGDKLVWGSDGARELYDVARDPAELRDRSAAEPARVRELELRLDALVRELAREPEPLEAPAMDPETESNLRALGYL